VCRSNL